MVTYLPPRDAPMTVLKDNKDMKDVVTSQRDLAGVHQDPAEDLEQADLQPDVISQGLEAHAGQAVEKMMTAVTMTSRLLEMILAALTIRLLRLKTRLTLSSHKSSYKKSEERVVTTPSNLTMF